MKSDNDTVPKSVYDQVVWEKDIALSQLNMLGYSFGEQPRTTKTVWCVTYLDRNDEPHVITFDNQLAADACFKHLYQEYKSDVWLDECELYGSFMVAGNK